MGVVKFIRICYLDLYSRQIFLQVVLSTSWLLTWLLFWSYEYMKIIYENCGVKNYMKEDHRSNSGLSGIWTLGLCNTGAALYQLSQQANWERVIELVCIKTVKGSNPVKAWIFLRLFFRNCKSCAYQCDDLLSYNNSYFAAHSPGGETPI